MTGSREPSSRHAPPASWAGRAMVVLAALYIIALAAWLPAQRHGDGYEYIYTTNAFYHHLTPNIRASDEEDLARVLATQGLPDGREGTSLEAANGLRFSLHFWTYPLLATPAWALLRLLGGNPLAAHQVTNGIFYLLAIFGILRSRAAPRKRLWFAVLAAIGPAFWYVRWPSPEVLTFACVTLALVMLEAERFALAALLAAIGTTHNPPLLGLVVLAIFLSARKAWERRQFTNFAATLLASSIVAIPPVFSLIYFGVPSLIAKSSTLTSNISWERTWSLLADLNQGLLPYEPALFLLFAHGFFQTIWQRHLRALGILGALLFALLTCQVATNWNCGSSGVIRYLVWMIPMFAWIAAEFAASIRQVKFAWVAVSAIHLGILSNNWDGIEDYLSHRPLARLALARFPGAYRPQHEIFAERSLHSEVAEWWDHFPIAYVRPDGVVTKVLTTQDALQYADKRFDVAADYRATLEGIRAAPSPPKGAVNGIFMLDLPVGTVRAPFRAIHHEWNGCSACEYANQRKCSHNSTLVIANLGDNPVDVTVEMEIVVPEGTSLALPLTTSSEARTLSFHAGVNTFRQFVRATPGGTSISFGVGSDEKLLPQAPPTYFVVRHLVLRGAP